MYLLVLMFFFRCVSVFYFFNVSIAKTKINTQKKHILLWKSFYQQECPHYLRTTIVKGKLITNNSIVSQHKDTTEKARIDLEVSRFMK